MKTLKTIFVICIAGVFLLTGCSTAKTSTTITEPVSTPVSVEEEKEDDDLKSVTGIYTGQIDSNSIEVKRDGLPEDSAYTAFAFSQQSKSAFDKLELNPNERVVIKYHAREGMQPLIITIQRGTE